MYSTNLHAVHGPRYVSASSGEELAEKIQKILKDHNSHEKDEYNAYWGLMPETPEHKKD